MYLAHHAEAERTGARIVHACGFDSIPHDLGVLLHRRAAARGRAAARARLRARRRPAVGRHVPLGDDRVLPRAPDACSAHAERKRVEPRPDGRRVAAPRHAAGRDRALGMWALPAADDRPAGRPALGARARALRPRLLLRPLRRGQAPARSRSAAWPASATLFALAQLPPTRKLLLEPPPAGRRPVARAARAKGWFKVRFVGEGGGQRRRHRGRGGDPGYGETSKMLAESALCLALDDLPQTRRPGHDRAGDGRRAHRPAARPRASASRSTAPDVTECPPRAPAAGVASACGQDSAHARTTGPPRR